MITSPGNPRIKAVAALRKRRVREAEQRFIVEGSRPIRRALESGWPLIEIFHSPELLGARAEAVVAEAHSHGVELTEIGQQALGRIAYRSQPEGVIAVAAHRGFELDAMPVDSGGLYLVTEAMEKPGNVGAMLRTAEAVGATGVVAADQSTDLTNPNVVRASQGALFSVPVAACTAEQILGWLTGHGIAVIASSPVAERSLWDSDLTGGIAVVVGSEYAGLSSTWSGCPSLHIPMEGAVDSLNAATSAAVIMFEARRQRVAARS